MIYVLGLLCFYRLLSVGSVGSMNCNPKPGSGYRRINQRTHRKAKRCDACREVQDHWCLVEVTDGGHFQQGGLWVESGANELSDIYKLCKICQIQVQGILDADLIWEIVEYD